MRKIFVSLNDCEPGMKIAETVHNDYGAVIIAENTILDEHLIRKLNNLDITKVRILYEEQDVIISNRAEIFRAQYSDNVEIVKDVLHDISSGKNVNIQKINNVSDTILDRMNENRDIVGCINQIRSIDEYTYTHCVNVSLLCMLLGKWMKYDSMKIKKLVQAGLLHDIGKSLVPEEILNKPTKLLPEEYEEIKKHTILGYRAIEKMPDVSKDVCMGVLMHHEREDGSGYPMGAKGVQIHEFAKIVGVADIYDAMTSNRVYREKESPFEVFELMENKAFGVLDPIVTKSFLTNIAAYYIGDFVKLNTGETGEIIYINPRHISQPVVRIDNAYVDLTVETDLKIVELI